MHAKSTQVHLASHYLCCVWAFSKACVPSAFASAVRIAAELVCLGGIPTPMGGLGMVGSAPTSYALKTYARWFLKGFATKILFQKEGLTLAFQTRQASFIHGCPSEARKKHTGNLDDSFSVLFESSSPHAMLPGSLQNKY